MTDKGDVLVDTDMQDPTMPIGTGLYPAPETAYGRRSRTNAW